MKKSMFFSAIIALLATIVNAQITGDVISISNTIQSSDKQESTIATHADNAATKKSKVPLASYWSKEAFYQDFGNIPVISWSVSKGIDEAKFEKEGHTYIAFYDFNSKLIGTTTQKLTTDLPMKAQDFIAKKYAGFTITDVILFDDNENNETDMVMYGQSFEDRDNYFAELKKGDKNIVVKINLKGDVSYFTQIR